MWRAAAQALAKRAAAASSSSSSSSSLQPGAQALQHALQAAPLLSLEPSPSCSPPAPFFAPLAHRSAGAARAMATNSHDVFNQHKDTPENHAETTFEWTQANLKRAQTIISRYPPNYKASAIIPVLDLAQQQNNGWLSLATMNAVAKLLDMPEIRVYEVATFYSMFNRSKIGKYHVMLCGTTPCRLQGAQGIQETLEKTLGVHMGETTKDGMFTLGEMECMGACVNAPMIAIANYSGGVENFSYNYYEDLTPADTVRIIEQLRKGEKPKVGSQYRHKAQPEGCVVDGKWVPSSGQMALTTPPRGPFVSNPALDQ